MATENTADSPMTGDNNRGGGRGAYLPVLPDGWAYEVHLIGPDGRVTCAPRDPAEGGAAYHVNIRPRGDDPRRLDQPNLSDAVRAAARAVKALAKMTKAQAEADAARRALLDDLGKPEPQPEQPTRSTAPADADTDR